MLNKKEHHKKSNISQEVKMIATLDRLMALSQKLRDAEKHTERDPIYLAVELNELHLLTRLLEDYVGELDHYPSSASENY